MGLEDCREKMPIWVLFGALGLGGADKVAAWGGSAAGDAKICSPFRPDNSPSFSVFVRDGVGFWKDHGTAEGGDEVRLIEMAKGVDNKAAIKIYHELAGVPWGRGGGKSEAVKRGPSLKRAEEPVERVLSAAERALGIDPEEKAPVKVRVEGEVKPVAARGPGELVKVYSYEDAAGLLAHETLRYEPKTFRQRRPAIATDEAATVRDGFVWSLSGARVFPYRLPQLLEWPLMEPVFLVEGEKDVENLERIGEVFATTFPMGAGKWREEYGEYFRGRWVVVVVDDDFAGRKGAAKVADELLAVCERVGLLELPTLWAGAPEGADVSDWLEWGWEVGMTVDEQRERLWAVADDADLEALDPYEGIIVKGSRGNTVAEDLLVRRLMREEKMIFVGDRFWRYVRGLGRWELVEDRSWMARKVRSVLRSRPGTEALITSSRVNSIVSLAKSERVHSPESLNRQPPGMMACRNGLVEVATGRLFPHREGYLTTVQVPHDFVPGAECPAWIDWLNERQDDQETRDQLQEIFGYCLMTDINYHSFFFLFGDGGTGKSTCVDVLESLVGVENRVSIELTELDNPFLRSRMVGRRLYLCKELTARSFRHIGLIKAIVSGDPVSVDVKYGEGFEFRPSGRLVMESNVQAMTPDSSAGFERRFIQVSFDKRIDMKSMDYNFGERFLLEMPGILNWAIEGYRRLKERGRFQHTVRSQKASDDIKMHRAQMDSFLRAGWVREEADVVGDGEFTGGTVWTGLLYELYDEWCDDHGVVPWFKEVKTFRRELYTLRPEWKNRALRERLHGVRDYRIEGLLMMRTSEQKLEMEECGA
jgi:P4 family phage/plasmid primase-like protien